MLHHRASRRRSAIARPGGAGRPRNRGVESAQTHGGVTDEQRFSYHRREERLSGYVLETGRVVLDGPRDALLADARVQRAYLGG